MKLTPALRSHVVHLVDRFTHRIVPPLDQVRSHRVPPERATPRDQHRLVTLPLLGVEDRLEHPQTVPKDGHKRRGDVGRAGRGIGVEDLVGELDGAGNPTTESESAVIS